MSVDGESFCAATYEVHRLLDGAAGTCETLRQECPCLFVLLSRHTDPSRSALFPSCAVSSRAVNPLLYCSVKNNIDLWLLIILPRRSIENSRITCLFVMSTTCHTYDTGDPGEKELVCFRDGAFAGYLRMATENAVVQSVFVTSDHGGMSGSSVCSDMLRNATSLMQGRATVAVDPNNKTLLACCLQAFFKMTNIERGDGKKIMTSTDRTTT